MKARCSEKPDLVIRNVQVFNTAFRGFYPADVYLLNGRFYYVDIKKEHLIEASETVEGHDPVTDRYSYAYREFHDDACGHGPKAR